MVNGLAMRCDTWENTLGAEEGFFECCLKIAVMGYEKSAAKGNVVLAKGDHPAIKTRISFRKPVELSNSRGVRKLLEMTRNNSLYLHTNSTVVWGLVELDLAQLNTQADRMAYHVFPVDPLIEIRLAASYLRAIHKSKSIPIWI
jgi:hypothetical protein